MKQKHFRCSICGLAYREKALAGRCKAWCSKHQSCNLVIAKHAFEK